MGEIWRCMCRTQFQPVLSRSFLCWELLAQFGHDNCCVGTFMTQGHCKSHTLHIIYNAPIIALESGAILLVRVIDRM